MKIDPSCSFFAKFKLCSDLSFKATPSVDLLYLASFHLILPSKWAIIVDKWARTTEISSHQTS